MTSSKEAPKLLKASEIECAPLIGRPTRPHAQHLTNHRRGSKQEEAIKTVYIHAETRIALKVEEAKVQAISQEDIIQAHRCAITTVVTDLFGNISGLPTLNFEIIKCKRLSTKDEDGKDQADLRFELIIGVSKSQVNNMITALSMITAGFGGGSILSLFVESNASFELRASAKLMVDVFETADFLTSLTTSS